MNTKFCVNCGKEILASSVFCKYCGAKQPLRPSNASDNSQPLNYEPFRTVSSDNHLNSENKSNGNSDQNDQGISRKITVLTTGQVPGHHYKMIKETFGIATQSNDLLRDSKDARTIGNLMTQAVQQLKLRASKMGADAVVAMHYNLEMSGVVVAYGTAVKFTG